MDTQEQKQTEGKRLWFRAKSFGWGWTPTSWEGWIVTFIYATGLIHFAIEANKQHSASDFLLNFAFDFVILSAFFLTICYYTGERPHWSWGQKPEAHQDSDTIKKV